jgi:hypothetical protein
MLEQDIDGNRTTLKLCTVQQVRAGSFGGFIDVVAIVKLERIPFDALDDSRWKHRTKLPSCVIEIGKRFAK